MNCLACGSSNVVEGIVADSNGRAVVFELAKRSLLRRILGVGQREVVTFACVHCGVTQQREVVTFACVHCGVTQQRVSFTDEDRARLATFEEPRPSVVDPER
jgi:hypothetical protein